MITIARQLTLHKRRPVDYTATKHTLQVFTQFDWYLKNLNEDLDDREIASEDGRR